MNPHSTLRSTPLLTILLIATPALVLSTACASSRRFPADAARLLSFNPPPKAPKIVVESGGELLLLKFPVPLDEMPAQIRANVEKRYPGGEIIGATVKEYLNLNERRYDIKKRINGREYEATFDPNYNFLFAEESISISDTPPEILASIARMTSGKIERVVRHRGPKGETLKFGTIIDEGGMKTKIQCDPDGKIIVHRRRVLAELEVDLE